MGKRGVPQCEESVALEKEIIAFLIENEFFWTEDLRKFLCIADPGAGNINGSRYSFYFYIIGKLRMEGIITCTERKGKRIQYFSTLFVNK